MFFFCLCGRDWSDGTCRYDFHHLTCDGLCASGIFLALMEGVIIISLICINPSSTKSVFRKEWFFFSFHSTSRSHGIRTVIDRLTIVI